MQGLSFQAGLLNVIGFEMTSRFASHVTGAVTFTGIEFADPSIGITLTSLVVPVFFLIGAFLSALLIQIPAFHGRSSLRYITPFWAVWCVVSLASLIPTGTLPRQALIIMSLPFQNEAFGLSPTHIVLLSLIAFACGAQNNLFLVERNLVFRTTHLTGTTSDLATHLVRIFFKLHSNSEQRNLEIRLASLRVLSIFAFFAGAAAGFSAHAKFQGRALYVPAFTSFMLAIFVTFYFYLKQTKKTVPKTEPLQKV
jgi:uncharacterized membrane protein YoaK (UPF0700 family)